MSGNGSAFLRAYPGQIPPDVETEIQSMHDHAEPPTPSQWPIFGIPTRHETFIVPIDDATAIRCTRSYYSLC